MLLIMIAQPFMPHSHMFGRLVKHTTWCILVHTDIPHLANDASMTIVSSSASFPADEEDDHQTQVLSFAVARHDAQLSSFDNLEAHNCRKKPS